MRLGITMSMMAKSGRYRDFAEFAQHAREIETAGFDSAYMGHRMPGPAFPLSDRYDPLAGLLVAASSTKRIELGTCVLIAGPLNKYDLFQRLYTLESLAPGRFCIGVGTGSGKGYYDSVGLDWDGRFARLADNMATVRALFEGGEIVNPEASGRMTSTAGETHSMEGPAPDAVPTNYPKRASRPQFVLGAWHSPTQLKRAVADYDGWMGSAGPGARFGGWRKVLSEGIARYRDLGGTRAMVATTSVDLRSDYVADDDDPRFSLCCPPEQAAERVQEIVEMGFDDLILNRVDRYTTVGPEGHRYDSTLEELEEIRSLLPVAR